MNEAIDMDAGSTRRLPAWMGKNDSPKLSTSRNMDEQPQEHCSMAKFMSSNAQKVRGKRRMFSGKCKTVLKTTLQEDAWKIRIGGGSNNSEHCCTRTKKKFEEKSVGCEQSVAMPSSSKQHKKSKLAKSINVKILPQGMNKDEVELTIEDLIGLAKECLRAGKETQPEPPVAKKPESVSDLAAPSASSTEQGGKLDGAIGSREVLTKCAQSSSFSNMSEEQVEEHATSAPQKIIHAGDPAQGMLELLLGPLLHQAPPKKAEQETAMEVLSAADESHAPGRNFVDVDEGPSLTKRKSRLKDKVALFFN